MLAGKKLYVLIAAALSMAAGGVGYSYVQHEKKQESFFGDGYVLTLDEAAGETTTAPVYFNAGTRYKVSYPDNVTFKTTDGKKTTVDYTNFVHYADGSIGAVTDGVLMELEQLKNGYINYYNVTSKSIMRKEGDKYILDNQGQELEFKDFVWKLSDSKYLVSSDALDVVLPNKSNLDTDGFVELNYLDDGIVQILTDDAAYQVLTAGTTVELANGMQIDTDSREIQNGDEQLMNLASLQVDSATNISVVPSANQAAMTVPKFNITTIDGVDGETGAAGEEGQIGENGANGEEGQAGEEGQLGENGNTGEDGDDGIDGDDGQDGDDGNDGSVGKAGKTGEAGKTGDTGSTGGTGGGGNTGGTAGGNNGGTGTTTSGTVMPVVRVEEFQYDSGSVSGRLSVEEGSGVTLGKGTLWITDVQTGKKVKMEEYELEEAVEINFNSSRLAGTGFTIESGREYQVTLEAEYTLDRTDSAGNQITGTTNLFMRTFSTNRLGVSEVYDHATTTELYVRVEKTQYSNVKDFKLVYQSVGGEEAATELSKTFETGKSSMDLTLDHDTELKPNTEYNVKLYAKNPSATDATNLWELISTHTYKTLKRVPSIGGKPIVALSPRGYFEIKPGVGTLENGEVQEISDPDNGIRKYRYEVYTADGMTMVTSVESDTFDPVSIYVDGTNVLYNSNYKVKLVVEFYDNEKTVEYATDFSDTFMMDSENAAPFMMFEKDAAISDANDPREGTDAVRSESIDGYLRFHFNHSNLRISATSPLTFEISSEAFIKDRTIQTIVEQPNAQEDVLSIPVHIKGLRANTTYRFNAYGTYNGDSSSTLLATCIVTTKKPDPLTIHMKEVNLDSHALSVKMYFTDKTDGSTKAPFEAYTMYQIKLGLYRGAEKIGSANVKFGRTDPNNQEYSGAAATEYFGDEDHAYLLTNESFNVGVSDINGYTGSFDVVVEGGVAYDYTAADEYRYSDDQGALGTYSNEIELLGDTDIQLKPTEVAPEIPAEGMKVVTILNTNASDFGFAQNGDLPGDAVVGFVLIPEYDNSGGYATRADYYIFDRYEYTDYIDSLDQDAQKKDPLKNSGTRPLMHYEYDLSSLSRTDDGLLPKLIVMIGSDPNKKKQDYYTVTQEGDYKGTRYIYADEYNDNLKNGTEGTVERVERGRSYFFPYDVNLSLNSNDEYRYPYDYSINGGGSGSYIGADQIMKNAAPIDAKRAEPVIEMYPYNIDDNNNSAVWNMKIKDVDGALTLDSFYSRNENRDETTSDFEKLPARDGIDPKYSVAETGEFLLHQYLTDLSESTNKWLQVDFKTPTNTGDKTTVALLMKYNALYDEGERGNTSEEKELTSFLFQKSHIPYFTASIYTSASAAGNTQEEKQQATIARDNAITFVIQTRKDASDSMQGVTAIVANVSDGTKKEQYYLTYGGESKTEDDNYQYRAVLPLSSIKEFMNKQMTITLQAVYEDGAYGYSENTRPSSANKLFSIVTGAGNYMVEDQTQQTLNPVSVKVGSMYDITDFTWKDNGGQRVEFQYKGYIYGRNSKVSMDANSTGFKWGDNLNMVFKPLKLSDPVTVTSNGSLSFSTMKPTISNTTVQPGLTSADFSFDLTEGIEELLDPSKKILFTIYERSEEATDSTGDKKVKEYPMTLEELKALLVGGTKNSYSMILDKLEKNKRYFIQVSGVLKGSSNYEPFLDTTGADNYIEFHTLDALKGEALGSTIMNRFYQDKMLYGRFGLNTTVGITLRYDVYQFDSSHWMSQDYTQEDMDEELENGKLIYTQKELTTNKMLTVPEIYTTNRNLAILKMWPQGTDENGGNLDSRFEPGKYYNIRIRAYKSGTDVDQDTMPEDAEVLGDFFMSRAHILYQAYPAPSAKVVAKFDVDNTSNLDEQNATFSIVISDNGKAIVSDYSGTYEEQTDGTLHNTKVTDRDGKTYEYSNGSIMQDLEHGAYMVRIYEAQYGNTGGIQTITGWKLLDDEYFDYTNSKTEQKYNETWVGRNLQEINLQKLGKNKEYKVIVYGAVDTEMGGGTTEINKAMLDQYLADKESGRENSTKVQELCSTTIHTLDSSGIYVAEDKLEVEQTSDSEIAIHMYNSAGLGRVKYVEYNFVQEDINENGGFDSLYTGLIPVDGDRIQQDSESNAVSVTDTWTLNDMSFDAKGRYRVVIKFYGQDANGDPSSDPIFSTTKYFRVTMLPASVTAKVAPESKTPVQLPQMFLTEEDKKKIKIG